MQCPKCGADGAIYNGNGRGRCTNGKPHTFNVTAEVEEQVQNADRAKIDSLTREISSLRMDNKRLSAVSLELETIRRIIGTIDANLTTDAPAWASKPITGKLIHGTPTLMLSDLHFGEVVFPTQVNNVNSYNTSLAKTRLKRVVTGAIKLLRQTLAPGAFGGMVCILGGDMVEGTIHDGGHHPA